MGMEIFTSNGTFNPANWGLKAGDMLQIVCVGAGGGGGACYYSYQYACGSAGISSHAGCSGGIAGQNGGSSGTGNGVVVVTW